jgi:hypothetical protein
MIIIATFANARNTRRQDWARFNGLPPATVDMAPIIARRTDTRHPKLESPREPENYGRS